jgi:putative oxidoreductase
VNRSLPAPVGDAALLLVRLVLAAILVAHGCRTLAAAGLGTAQGIDTVPVTTWSASLVPVVEIVGAVLLLAGVLTAVVAVLAGLVVAAVPHALGGDGGWEIAGAFGAALVALAVAGPGRWSVAHLRHTRRARSRPQRPAAPVRFPVAASDPGPDSDMQPVPPAGLPVTPLIRLSPHDR